MKKSINLDIELRLGKLIPKFCASTKICDQSKLSQDIKYWTRIKVFAFDKNGGLILKGQNTNKAFLYLALEGFFQESLTLTHFKTGPNYYSQDNTCDLYYKCVMIVIYKCMTMAYTIKPVCNVLYIPRDA